jgi:hypothetical protein
MVWHMQSIAYDLKNTFTRIKGLQFPPLTFAIGGGSEW